MEIREIESLVALSRLHSILATAQELNLTSGAVHKHLKTLEAEFGVPLYEKREGGLHLTKAAEIALPYLQGVLEQRHAAVQAVSDWKGKVSGTVRVGAGPSFSSYMLPAILSKFRKRHREAEVYVETGGGDQLLQHLRAGTLDLVFDVATPISQGSELLPLAEWEARIGVVSALPDLPQRCTINRLSRVPFILFARGSRMDTILDDYFKRVEFRPRVVMRSDSAEAIKAMVKSRLGVAMLFLWNANAEFRTGALGVVNTDAPPLVVRMALLRRQGAYLTKATDAFVTVARGMNWKNLHPVPLAVIKPASAGSEA